MSNRSSTSLFCGWDVCCLPDLQKCVKAMEDERFDFVCLPIVHPRYKQEFISGKSKQRREPFTRAADLLLTETSWSRFIVGKVSPYLNVDSKNEIVRKQSTEELNQQLNYMIHLGLLAVMLPLRSNNQVNLARVICAKMLSSYHQMQVWVRIPMVSTGISVSHHLNTEDSVSTLEEDTWIWWNTFRSVCNIDTNPPGLALEVAEDIPSDEVVERWLGEPVKCLIVSTSLFTKNKKGFPILSASCKLLLRKFAHLDVKIVLTGAELHGPRQYYREYLQKFWADASYVDPLWLYFTQGHRDSLMCPLQPLQHNLSCQTYETFEKDPVKYNEYARAVYYALLDRVPEDQKTTAKPVVMVLGAGRGPLVRATLFAASKADIDVKVYAVEKNPHALASLFSMQLECWKDKVTVVSSDMRDFNPPEKADIIVSELLGSFGDNELSPECLEGALRFLKEDGISIPMKYTSYLSPVQTFKLFSDVCRQKDKERNTVDELYQTPYVAFIQNKYQIAPFQEVFTFSHPNRDEDIDNSRYKVMNFQVAQKSVLHGFSGYFETVLYSGPSDSVLLSIKPDNHTKNLISWFPMFFPLRQPVHVSPGDTITLHFWRVGDTKNVWYEWALSSPVPLPIHNSNGRSFKMGL